MKALFFVILLLVSKANGATVGTKADKLSPTPSPTPTATATPTGVDVLKKGKASRGSKVIFKTKSQTVTLPDGRLRVVDALEPCVVFDNANPFFLGVSLTGGVPVYLPLNHLYQDTR